MSFLNEFAAEFGGRGLNRRADGFLKAARHCNIQTQPFIIVETGTAREEGSWGGDGQSTLIWDWIVENKKNCDDAFSIDISEKNIRTAERLTRNVSLVLGDSIDQLTNMNCLDKCKLLYLDSMDLNIQNPLPSSAHHLAELMTAWSRLPSGCLIMVDDCLTHNKGKHLLVREFFKAMKIPAVIESYICGWVKP
jgi:cephalosporin hydroxylase